jgi:hypothetical protein
LALFDTRLAGESIKAWAAFTIYRDLALRDRTIRAAWRKLNKRKTGDAPGRWDLWSRQFRWVERAAAYEGHLDEQRRRVQEAALRKVAERMAEYEIEVQVKAEKLVERMWGVLEKQADLPPTDTERIEDKEVVVNEAGEIKVVTTRTRLKGIKISGFARATDSYRAAMVSAVNPRRKSSQEGGSKPGTGPKSALPDFMRRALDNAHLNKEPQTTTKESMRDAANAQTGQTRDRDSHSSR